MNFPHDERKITDHDFFKALDLSWPDLKKVAEAYHKNNLTQAKYAVVEYFRTLMIPMIFGGVFRVLMSTAIFVGAGTYAEVSTPPPAGGWHINNQDPNCSDENPGTFQRPWRTFKKGVTSIRSGQTLYIHEGIYRVTNRTLDIQWLNPGISGTQGNPTIIRNYPGDIRRRFTSRNALRMDGRHIKAISGSTLCRGT